MAVYSYGSLPCTVETTAKRNAVRSCNPAIWPRQYARDTRGFELCVQNLVSSSDYDVRSRGRDTWPNFFLIHSNARNVIFSGVTHYETLEGVYKLFLNCVLEVKALCQNWIIRLFTECVRCSRNVSLGSLWPIPDANYLTYTGEFPFEVEVIRI